MLIGQECQELLLEKATHVNQTPISDYLPDFCRDISLQLSPATSKLSFVGAIGQPTLENFQPGFNLNAKDGKYVLFKSPSENLKMMLTKSKHSSFIVQPEQRCSQKFMTSNFDKSGPDNDHSNIPPDSSISISAD